jgi:hypothetical protein
LTFYILEKIKRPKEEIDFCYTVRRPFTAAIHKRKKIRMKFLKEVVKKTCSKCGHVTEKSIFKTRKVWSSWSVAKQKECRSKKRAVALAKKWYDSYINRKPRAVKVAFT